MPLFGSSAKDRFRTAHDIPCLAELATGAEVSVQMKLFDRERCDAMQRRDGSGKSVLSLLNRKTGLQLKAGPMRTEST
jgi:hypothetical protein